MLRRMLITLSCFCLTVALPSVVMGSVPESWHSDADLRDIHFVDASFGWAVGDHGTIWHTQNGGEVWHRQDAGLSSRLNAVYFVDRQQGFIAGGEIIPQTHRSKSVIARTTDGGKTWEKITGLLLPTIQRLHFLNEKVGYAVGAATAIHPGGAWSTQDGGRTWSPLQGTGGNHWCDAAFVGDRGILVGRGGARALAVDGRLQRLREGLSDPLLNYQSVAMLSRQVAFTASSYLEMSADAGNTWQQTQVTNGIEARSIATQGRHVWMAGSPGSRIVRSTDMGGTWQSVKTPGTLPLHRVWFLDPQNGWAVGSRGMILGTDDAGTTWKLKRGGAKRIALLGVFADEDDIPWDLLAQASAGDSWRVHCVVLAKVADDSLRCELEQRLQVAAMEIGATAEVLTRLPYPDGVDATATDLISRWGLNRLPELSARLTKLVRVYRPDVVVSALAGLPGGTNDEAKGAQRLVDNLLDDACSFAANPEVFTHQIQQLGLSPWTVSRRLQLMPTRNPVPSLDAVPSVRGDSLASLAQRARQLVSRQGLHRDMAWSLYAVDANRDSKDFGRYPLVGLTAQFDSAQRRPRPIGSAERAAQKGRLMSRIQAQRLLNAERFVGRGEQRIAHIERMLADRVSCSELFFRLASVEADKGEFEEADLLHRHIIAHYSDQPLSEASIVWLVQQHASLERMWLEARRNAPPVQPPSKGRDVIKDPNIQLATAEQPAASDQVDGTSDLNADFDKRVSSAQPLVDRNAAAAQHAIAFKPNVKVGLQLAREVKSKRPDLYGVPDVVFPFAALSLQDDQENAARSFYRRLASLPDATPWRKFANRELGLLDSKPTDRNHWPCVRLNESPYLDGQLNDPCWQNAKLQTLGDEHDRRTTIAMMRDDDFLYIAASCPRRSEVDYLPPRRPRPRDADLSGLDRIRLTLDVNRDYTSWWVMEFDQRGWTRESLMGDLTWNPKYYLASFLDEENWTIEAAIPLDELAPDQNQAGHWVIGMERIVPGSHVERWNTPIGNPDVANVQGLLRLDE